MIVPISEFSDLPLEQQSALGLPVLAVLPFTNMSGDDSEDYVSDGITADLINEFSRLSGLSVIARNTMFTYKNAGASIREIGHELNADHVLEGSVRKVGNRIRVNAQLIDAQTERDFWPQMLG